MPAPSERILIVENDRETSDILCRQALQPLGYRVDVVQAASQAIQSVSKFAPDVILADLDLPGLSGKDLLVALTSQGMDMPVIVIARKGMEGDVIQAFRLGASDYLFAPLREAEVVATVERALKQVRARREREQLARQLNQANQELRHRVRELTTIYAIGKAVTSITSQRALFNMIVDGAVNITEADHGWLLLREERSKPYLLSACRNLPESLSQKIGEPFDDGISSLVALSGETLSIYGEPLKRFKVYRLGQSALVVPVKVKNEVMGLLVVIRKKPLPFSPSNQTLLEAVADYASISLVNARLFQALEDRAHSLQQVAEGAQIGERIKDEMIISAVEKLRPAVSLSLAQTEELLQNHKGVLNESQSEVLLSLKKNLERVGIVAEMLQATQKADGSKQRGMIDLNALVRQITARYQRTAQSIGITLFAELSRQPISVQGNIGQLSRVVEGLLNHALKQSMPGGLITTRVEVSKDDQKIWAHISVKDNGPGLEPGKLTQVFEPGFSLKMPAKPMTGSLGIGLPLLREVVLNHGGQAWAESEIGKGSILHVTLPISQIPNQDRVDL